MDAEVGSCRDRAAGRAKRCRRARGLFVTAPEWAGAISAVGAVWIASASALAYHDTINTGRGGAPLEVILPIVGAVALGIIALAVFSRKPRKTKVKAGSRKRRTKPPAQKASMTGRPPKTRDRGSRFQSTGWGQAERYSSTSPEPLQLWV